MKRLLRWYYRVFGLRKENLLWKAHYHLSRQEVKLAFLACYSYLYLLIKKESRVFEHFKWKAMVRFTLPNPKKKKEKKYPEKQQQQKP